MSGVAGVAFRVVACGDSAVRVTAQGADREECWRAVHAIAAAIDTDADRFAITGVIPTYDAVLIEFDCAASTHDDIRQLLANLVRDSVAPTPRPARHFDIPVVYGGEYGPDLDDVADQLGLSPAEVIRVHGSSPLTMRCFGSPGGAPMLDGPAFPRPVPRRVVPRPHVPAGAVAVAGRQAVVSARPAPGGWPVIGRTPRTMVDPTTEPLSAFRPGDTFRFHAIAAHEWSRFEGVLHG
ncbi:MULTISPECIES: carboxyltransferase domain-containing protein [unclassified Nocardia]|jgi:KipI family sensor histidine kinase inhibitor|uniref:5-oxoprolinase subunit B family protein n=1 Tax=unclassified Nocardia TaxID=2637762 RepID=UPI003437ACF4